LQWTRKKKKNFLRENLVLKIIFTMRVVNYCKLQWHPTFISTCTPNTAKAISSNVSILFHQGYTVRNLSRKIYPHDFFQVIIKCMQVAYCQSTAHPKWLKFWWVPFKRGANRFPSFCWRVLPSSSWGRKLFRIPLYVSP